MFLSNQETRSVYTWVAVTPCSLLSLISFTFFIYLYFQLEGILDPVGKLCADYLAKDDNT